MKEKKLKIKWKELSALEQEALVLELTNKLIVNAYLLCYKTMEKALEKIKKHLPGELSIEYSQHLYEEKETVEYIYQCSEDVVIPVILKMHSEKRYFSKYHESLEECAMHGIRMNCIPSEFVTEELMCIAAKNQSHAISYMDKSKVTANVIMAAAECKYEYVNSFLHNYIHLLDDAQLTKILIETRDAVNVIPKERWTKEMLYAYLEDRVRKNIPVNIDYMCKIPEELKDVVYWRSLCMLHGYWYSVIPKELKEKVIFPKLIQATIERWDDNHNTRYNGLGWMLDSLPEKYVTEELQVEICKRYPPAVRSVLKNKDVNRQVLNEEFLDKIAAYNDCRFLDWAEDNQLPEKYREHKKQLMIKTRFGNVDMFCSKKHSLEEWTEYIKHHGEAIDRVPKKYLSEEMCMNAMRSNGFAALGKIPEEFKTKAFWETVVREKTYCKPVHVPEEYITKEEVLAFCKEHNITSDSDIPKKYRTEDVLLEIVTGGNVFISKENQTPAIVKKALDLTENINSKVFVLSKTNKQHWPKAMVDELCRTCKDAMRLDLEKEQIDVSIASFPSNILYAPQWYKEEIRNQKENKIKVPVAKIVKEEKEESTEINNQMEYSQISIWDILAG